MLKHLKRFIPSVLIGAVSFLAFFTLFEAGFLASLLLSLAGAAGGFLLFTPREIDPEFAELERIYGITPSVLKKTINYGNKKLKKMRLLKDQIDEKSVRDRVEKIARLTERIFEDFKKDPKDIKAARQFLNYYLDATLNIIEKYRELSKMKSDPDREKTIRKVNDLLLSVERAFENQLHQLYNDDFLDLDTEISVLEKAIKQDGLSDKKGQAQGSGQ